MDAETVAILFSSQRLQSSLVTPFGSEGCRDEIDRDEEYGDYEFDLDDEYEPSLTTYPSLELAAGRRGRRARPWRRVVVTTPMLTARRSAADEGLGVLGRTQPRQDDPHHHDAFLLASLWIILSNRYDEDVQKWAFGAMGSILGFWLRPND